MNKKLSAIIAVRKGSKRVIDKNIRPFADTSLLEIKIKQLLRTSGINEIIVSSDCERMLGLASLHGVNAIERDTQYTNDTVPMNKVYRHLASLANNKHILYVHVTSPLLKDSSLQSAIVKYQNLPDRYDSLASVKGLKEYLWNQDGPINYDPSYHPRSQDLQEIYALNFAINIIDKDLMMERKNIIGSKPFLFALDKIESIDVDHEEDFLLAELIYKNLYKEK